MNGSVIAGAGLQPAFRARRFAVDGAGLKPAPTAKLPETFIQGEGRVRVFR